jgi:uncharacterized protein (DUF305 family)
MASDVNPRLAWFAVTAALGLVGTGWRGAGPLLAQATPAASFAQMMHQSMTVMQHDMMAAPMTGNADRDFVRMMTPHHQGAIDMARAELLYGHDPVLKRLAQEIIVDQQSEIEAMQLWAKKHP